MTCKNTQLKVVEQRKITYTGLNNSHANLANIDGIVIATTSLGIGVEEGRILPGSLWNKKKKEN